MRGASRTELKTQASRVRRRMDQGCRCHDLFGTHSSSLPESSPKLPAHDSVGCDSASKIHKSTN
eukprot:4507689-Pyramimonas_sp.AAC.1